MMLNKVCQVIHAKIIHSKARRRCCEVEGFERGWEYE